ncbi:hypothetical protein KTAU_25430 [Thermogemmatispora aurantia]|uniref:Uncharacterized protein n=1 Tax=Thermogemmatispora aurantia TaxID=2045279 RepID=A0A5J4KCX1_9CHLR|nr:hypothetical protein KTAU_25430 [Thermogemmatispora aurantia]
MKVETGVERKRQTIDVHAEAQPAGLARAERAREERKGRSGLLYFNRKDKPFAERGGVSTDGFKSKARADREATQGSAGALAPVEVSTPAGMVSSC